ncbi:MAG: hypothetical protein IPK79_03870 [Vampirovibrionales bacterium]|nr:hypothetical protein [Vampirovibrionales bacterium]
MEFRIALMVYACVFLLTLRVLNAPDFALDGSMLGLLTLLSALIVGPAIWQQWRDQRNERPGA